MRYKEMKKDKEIKVRVDKELLDMVDIYCEALEITKSDLVRGMLLGCLAEAGIRLDYQEVKRV